MGLRGAAGPAGEPGRHQHRQHQRGGHQLERVAVETGADRRGGQQPEQHRAGHRPRDPAPQRPPAEQRLAEQEAGEPGDHRADDHLDVGEAGVLGEERAGERHEAVGEAEAEDHHAVHVERDGAGHLQRRPPAVLADWNERAGRFDDFSWAVTADLADRIGLTRQELEDQRDSRGDQLSGSGRA